MGQKKKLEHFAEMKSFPNVVEPHIDEVFRKDYTLKGKWAKEFFGNDNPIVLELGCGKGEYTLGLARLNPNINYIGIDVKGARMWRGSKTALEEGIKNAGFLRTRIELITSFFAENEISEIWFTFPDPQTRRALKRLTGSRFLGYYQHFVKDNGFVNLKTDSEFFFAYTQKVVKDNELELVELNEDIYKSDKTDDPVLSIRTHYESKWLKEDFKSKYIKFRLPAKKELIEPEFEFDGELR